MLTLEPIDQMPHIFLYPDGNPLHEEHTRQQQRSYKDFPQCKSWVRIHEEIWHKWYYHQPWLHHKITVAITDSLGQIFGFYVAPNSRGHIGARPQYCHLWESNPHRDNGLWPDPANLPTYGPQETLDNNLKVVMVHRVFHIISSKYYTQGVCRLLNIC